jgi:cell division transport system ATP-binding protein
MELFWEINALGMTVLMATHDLELMRRYPSARVLELDQGHLVYDSANTEQAVSGVDGNSQPDANASPALAGEPEPAQQQET